jgi:hypothetical protein
MITPNPARKYADAASQKLIGQANELIKEIQKNLDAGFRPDTAVAEAWKRVGYQREIEKITIDGILKAMNVGLEVNVTLTQPLQTWLLSSYVDADGVNLSSKIWELSNENKGIVVGELKAQMVKNSSWTATAKAIVDKGLTESDVSTDMRELLNTARRAYGGDADALAKYRKDVLAAQRYVDRLAANNAPTERLKKAYQSIIDATAKGTDNAMDKALDRAVRAKARYNADRLSRTEIARAYGNAVKDKALADDDAIGIKSSLSSRHEDVDICDFYAYANLYGMGPGVFPKTELPPYPYHPHDLCSLIPVYKGEVGAWDDLAAQKWIKGLSADERQGLLGVDGAEAFKEDPTSWADNMRGYQDPEPTETTFPVNLLDSSSND